MAGLDVGREASIVEALEIVQEGGSIRSAACNFNIPLSTLRDRRDGAQSRTNAQEDTRRLSNLQEKRLIEWILAEEQAGRAPSRHTVQCFAACIASCGTDDTPIGNNWVDRFLQRHEDIKIKISKSLEAARSNATTAEALTQFYTDLESVKVGRNIRSSRIANIDETGIAEGAMKSGKVIGTSLKPFSVVTDNDNSTRVSILEAITADGRRLTPSVVFTGTKLQGQWFPRDFPDWKYSCNLSGWSNSSIFEKWFEQVYLKETKPRKQTQWRVLILDGHSTHIQPKVMYSAWKNRVKLMYLPAHSSHITQALDFGVFGPLKRFFREEARRYATFKATSPINKQRFLRCYKIASERVFSEKNIRKGFSGSGTYPVDVQKPLSRIVDTGQSPKGTPLPSTPKRQRIEAPGAIWTPRNRTEITSQLLELEKTLNGVHRDVRTLASKAGKQINSQAASIAELSARFTYLEDELASQQPSGRVAVAKNPNTTFNTVCEIEEAREEAQRQVQRRSAKLGAQRTRAAEENAESIENAVIYCLS